MVTDRAWVQSPSWLDHCVRFIAVYALRFKSQADSEGSTVSSLNTGMFHKLSLEQSNFVSFVGLGMRQCGN